MLPATASRQPLPLISMPCDKFLHLLLFPVTVLGLTPVICQTLGSSPITGTAVTLCPCVALPDILIRVLGYSGLWFLFGFIFA